MSEETTTVDNTEDDLTVSQTNTDAEPDLADTDNTEDRTDEEGDTFPRSHVERLRRESAGYRNAPTLPTSLPSGCTLNWSGPRGS